MPFSCRDKTPKVRPFSRSIIFSFRRVHITKATLVELGAKFEVEDGKGRERDEVLAKLDIDTFLIIPPKQQVTYSIIYTITFSQ